MNERLEDKVSESKAILRHDANALLKKALFLDTYEEKVEAFKKSFQLLIRAGYTQSNACELLGHYAKANRLYDLSVKYFEDAKTSTAYCFAGDIYGKMRNAEMAAKCYEKAITGANGTKPLVIRKTIDYYKKLNNLEKIAQISEKYSINRAIEA